jgi:hypothetical protein
MVGLSRILAIIVLLALAPAVAVAKSEHRTQRVTFKDGRAMIKGRIKGYQYVDYMFPAGAGESLKANLKTNNNASYFNLLASGQTEAAFFIGSVSGDSYEGVAPASGDYTARIYLMRSAARRGEAAKYTLTITLGEKSAANETGPDYADGLTGGPDYWEVTGVSTHDTLSLRKDPSRRGALVAQFVNGTVLRNLGCKNARGQRWCRIERPDDPSLRGWVNGRYLRASSGPR